MIQNTVNDWNAEDYAEHFSFVPDYGRDVIKLISGENLRVLDLGCGNGALTKVLAELGHDVQGMDSSDSQLALARRTCPGIKFIKADATDFHPDEQFDVVFSNAVLHWIDEDSQPDMMLCVRDCLKKGGQFVFEMGGYSNNRLIHAELERQFKKRGFNYEMPFYFPTIGQYSSLLEGTGLMAIYAHLCSHPTLLDGDDGLVQWMKMFVRKPFEGIDESTGDKIRRDAAETLKDKLFRDGKWYADYVRLRMKAIKI